MKNRKEIEKRQVNSERVVSIGYFLLALVFLIWIIGVGVFHYFNVILAIIVAGIGFVCILGGDQRAHEAEYELKFLELKDEISVLSALLEEKTGH